MVPLRDDACLARSPDSVKVGPGARRPADAGRRAPSRRRAARPASRGTPSARGAEVPARHAARAAYESDPRARGLSAAPPVAAGHPAVGSRACRRILERPDNPLRVLRGDGGGIAGRGCRAWWGRPAPSDARDGLVQPVRDSPESDSSGPDGAAPVAAPAESSGSGLPLPAAGPRRRAA